jgi:preprotein translocase subunit SecG
MILRKQIRILPSIIIILLIIMVPILIIHGTGSPGGRGSANREYNCSGSSCHATRGSSTIRMSASNLTPIAGQVIKVTVTVTGSEASSSPMGVFLIRSLTSGSSRPSVDGWEIITDPSGSTSYNYYERPDVTGGDTWVWTLRTPEKPGNYRLYAREHNGNGNSYWNDHTDGITIKVGANTDASEDPEPTDATFYIILIIFILSILLIFYLLHSRQEKAKAKDRRPSRKRSKDLKGSRSTNNKHSLTKCDVCGCSLKEENLERHLRKVHNV